MNGVVRLREEGIANIISEYTDQDEDFNPDSPSEEFTNEKNNILLTFTNSSFRQQFDQERIDADKDVTDLTAKMSDLAQRITGIKDEKSRISGFASGWTHLESEKIIKENERS